MNLFIDAHILDGAPQGTTTYLIGLYKELIRRNNNIIFFFGAHNIDNLKKEFGENTNLRFIEFWTRNKYLRLAINIPYIIHKYKIDISHYQYILPVFRLSKEILTIHDILFMDFPRLFPFGYRIRNKILFKHSAKRADIILTVSMYSKERISKHFKIDMNKIHVIPNGVADDFFETDGSLPNIKKKYNLNKYILYVSRFEPRKNHLLLLRAFFELELWKNGYKLVLVGSRTLKTPLFDAYMESQSGKVRKSVLIIKKANRNELKSLYRNCQLFVYPSLAEGFGIPPLEAAASAVPVLCSSSTAMKDFKFLGDNLFNPEDIEELKEKIKMILTRNKNEFNVYTETVKLNYNWESSAALFSDVIFSINE